MINIFVETGFLLPLGVFLFTTWLFISKVTFCKTSPSRCMRLANATKEVSIKKVVIIVLRMKEKAKQNEIDNEIE